MKNVNMKALFVGFMASLLVCCGQNPELTSPTPPTVPGGELPPKPVHCEALLNRSATTSPKVDMVPSTIAFKGDLSANFASVSFGEAANGEAFASFAGTAFEGLSENFALRCEFRFNMPTPGSYKFTMGSDDGSALYVDQKGLISNNGNHALTIKTATLTLAAHETGLHTVVVLYAQGNGPKALTLSVQAPNTPAIPGHVSSL